MPKKVVISGAGDLISTTIDSSIPSTPCGTPLGWRNRTARLCRALRAGKLFERRLGHTGFPCRIAQLQTIAARIEEIELPPGEKAFGAVVEAVDRNLAFLKNLARLHERFGAHRK